MTPPRAGDRPSAQVQTAIRDAAKAASEMYGPDQHVSISMAVLDALRSLPVEQRMEAMGMVPVGKRDGLGPMHYAEVLIP